MNKRQVNGGTQREKALRGEISAGMISVAHREGCSPEEIMAGVAAGRIAIPANILRPRPDYCGVGRGLSTKVNANIGTARGESGIAAELRKLKQCVKYGADAVMDLSTGPDIDGVRRALIGNCPVAFGTVPIYQAAVEAQEARGAIVAMTDDDILGAVQKQAEDGVDFMTIHCGLTLESLERMRRHPRIADIVSRGGSFLTAWMIHHQQENPFYRRFDDILEIARRYDITLSLGDALRPGCIADATDRGQVQELLVLGELVSRCREAGVQVIVEGPGHVPLDQVEMNIRLQKRLCHEAPFYVLGPLVTDVAPGYDHITAAIGGAVAAAAGADFICYVTPSEHLGLPDEEDVKQGIMAARIAGHAADIAKGIKGAARWDRDMAVARKAMDWDIQRRLSMDPGRFDRHAGVRDKSGCSMCGPYCAMKIVSQYLGRPAETC